MEHENIVRLVDIVKASDYMFLILEYCNSDLRQMIIQQEKKIDPRLVKNFMN